MFTGKRKQWAANTEDRSLPKHQFRRPSISRLFKMSFMQVMQNILAEIH
jgi:hypothetical protein